MKIDIDQLVADVRARPRTDWDLSLTLGGEHYAVRQVSPADLAGLASLEGKPAGEVVGAIAALFDPKPSPATLVALGTDGMSAVAGAINSYLQEYLRKNSQAAGKAAAAAVQKALRLGGKDSSQLPGA